MKANCQSLKATSRNPQPEKFRLRSNTPWSQVPMSTCAVVPTPSRRRRLLHPVTALWARCCSTARAAPDLMWVIGSLASLYMKDKRNWLTFRSASCIRVPPGADPKFAVVLVLYWVTAYQMLHHAAQVKLGQRIFVHGLSGAVGQALLVLGKIQGAQVFGTASSGKQDELRRMGAVPFDYANKNWITAMNAVGGADAVPDPLGFESLDESYSILRKGGILVGYGVNLPGLTRTHPRPVIPAVLKLFARNLLFWSGKRTTFFGVRRTSRHFAPDLELLFEWLQSGKISVPVKAVFKLQDVQSAHREYASGKGTRSIILEVNP